MVYSRKWYIEHRAELLEKYQQKKRAKELEKNALSKFEIIRRVHFISWE